MPKICIGIDQSYKNCGWSICLNNKIVEYGNIDYKGCKTPTDKRICLSNSLIPIIDKSLKYANLKPNKVIIIVERIRLRSQGFLSTNYIQATASLISVIVDTAYKYGINVYSVDTRSWKSRIVGSSKGKTKKVEITKGKNKGKFKTVTDNKTDTLNYVKNVLGIDTKNDDDIADAICISKYAFLNKQDRKLKQEH